MSTISTHVLDTMRGRPARGVEVILHALDAAGVVELGRGRTNEDGRLGDLLAPSATLKAGEYRLTFLTGPWFEAEGIQGFYPRVTIDFTVAANQHYHVPLLLSPFGYTTYRGS